MHNTMRNTIQNGISHSITSVLSIKQRISHTFSSLSKTFLIDFPSNSICFFTVLQSIQDKVKHSAIMDSRHTGDVIT